MDVWTAIVIIVIAGSLSGIAKNWFERNKDNGSSKKELQEVLQRLQVQEERIKNLETVIFEIEKERKFDSLDS